MVKIVVFLCSKIKRPTRALIHTYLDFNIVIEQMRIEEEGKQ